VYGHFRYGTWITVSASPYLPSFIVPRANNLRSLATVAAYFKSCFGDALGPKTQRPRWKTKRGVCGKQADK